MEEQAEILVRFDNPAPPKMPFMYHCHILEHEDHGMMGQFAVVVELAEQSTAHDHGVGAHA